MAQDDQGVARNGGRLGTRFAPRAIVHCLEKMVAHNETTWQTHPVCSQDQEPIDFVQAQKDSSQLISSLLDPQKITLHLGGGHDHIYPLLKALEAKAGATKLTIINIDAHCDTRPDPHPHSGTPFRQFDQDGCIDFELIQLGIRPHANSPQTLSPLQAKMALYPLEELPREGPAMSKFLSKIVAIAPTTHYVLSLDCDALSATFMEGVSAVSYDGMSLPQVQSIFEWAKQSIPPARLTYGIYEYNPLFDNLSQKGARALAALIYQNCFAP